MYDREKAIEYALEWALKRNPDYYNFELLGGDCTNFISQCLVAGGVKFSYIDYGWFYHSLNSRSPSWTGVDEIFNFAINNNQNSGPKFEISTINNLEIGDIIQLKVNNVWTHTLIITKIVQPITEQNIFVCAHTFDAKNRQLSTYEYSDIRYCKVKNNEY